MFEEHYRAGIERERECTNQREGQKYGNLMLAIWLSGAANATRTQKMRLSQQLSTHSSLVSIRGKKGVTYLPLTCIQL